MSQRATRVAVLLALAALGGACTGGEALSAEGCDLSLTLPTGFCARIYADRLGAPRHLVVAPWGDVFAALTESDGHPGGLVALRDTNSDGRADLRRFVPGEGGTGIALRDSFLYAAGWTAVYRYRVSARALGPRTPADTVLAGLPRSGHAARSIAVDSAHTLFLNIGAPSNACQLHDVRPGSPGRDPCPELESFGGIWRFDARRLNQRQSHGVRVATGLRHVVALSLGPGDRGLYGVQHGRDQLDTNWPDRFTREDEEILAAEELFHIEEGADYGWPYCFHSTRAGRKVLSPEYGGDGRTVGRCASKREPVFAFPAHWAPNALLFYRGSQFPPRYRGGAFIAFHGGWFRSPPRNGFNVVFLPWSGQGPARDFEVFADGFAGRRKHPREARHRPTGLAEGTDGAFYVSDDAGGRIWKITYHPEPARRPP